MPDAVLIDGGRGDDEKDLMAVTVINRGPAALNPSEEEIKKAYVSVLSELSAKEAHVLKRMYAEWSYWQQPSIPDWKRDKEHRYSSGIASADDETAVHFYRLGLILPVHVKVEEYRNQASVTPRILGPARTRLFTLKEETG